MQDPLAHVTFGMTGEAETIVTPVIIVGGHVDVRHLSATPLGRRAAATSRVIEKTCSIVLYAVEADDYERLIGAGKHRRGVVDGRSFGKTT